MLDLGDFRDKMTVAGVDTDSNVYHALCDAIVALSAWNLSESEILYGLDFISGYGLDQLEDLPKIPGDAWATFDYGNTRVGEYVKVSPDAYDSDTGYVHNGRLGIIVGLSGHRAMVRYITDPTRSTMHHPIDRLLSLKYVVKSKFTPNNRGDV